MAKDLQPQNQIDFKASGNPLRDKLRKFSKNLCGNDKLKQHLDAARQARQQGSSQSQNPESLKSE